MCGIIGSILKHPQTDLDHRFHRAMTALRHRGPDDEGIRKWCVSNGNFPTVYLGHKRLSIIDRTADGRQPMTTVCGRYTVVFNGEIYNYRELRKELRVKGHSFLTDTDTEVLLKAWAEWGPNSIRRFVGMFAFAILDELKRELVCVRDAFGIKPLFYAYQSGVSFQFASELGALLELREGKSSISHQRVFDYLHYGLQDSGSDTFVKGIRHLQPAQYLTIDLRTLNIKENRFWWRPQIAMRHRVSFADAAEELRELFLKNVALHLRSDVPVGAALSGGIDSSAIVCAMRKVEPDLPIHTFSYIPSDQNISESKWINNINKHVGAVPHFVSYTGDELFKEMPELARIQGEPFNSTSMYAQYRVFKAAREHSIPVILEGQGADELLGGYHAYPGQCMRSMMERGQFSKLWHFATSWPRNASRGNKSPWRSLFGQMLPEKLRAFVYNMAPEATYNRKIKKHWKSKNGIRDSTPDMGIRWSGYGRRLTEALSNSVTGDDLPSLLRFGDRNAMHFAVENRVPFLTVEMADYMFGLPESYLVSSEGVSKHLFRAAMRGIVPDSILNRQDKVGFDTPLSSWIMQYQNHLRDIILCSSLKNILDVELILKGWDTSLKMQPENSYLFWRLTNLAMWVDGYKETIKTANDQDNLES